MPIRANPDSFFVASYPRHSSKNLLGLRLGPSAGCFCCFRYSFQPYSKPKTMDQIIVKGAKMHNLKNIDVQIPRNKLTVITGLSGSGKSSLAFDTILAEGQRRYVESLSAYARQFIAQMEKPEVESIEGPSPAISIDQKTSQRNPRSTVGTVTEIYDYMRLLWAKVGQVHCSICGRKLTQQSSSQ